MPVENQIAIIFAVTNGHLDDVEVENIRQWELDFHEFMAANKADLLQDVRDKKVLDDDLTERLRQAIEAFKAIA
jgi:F-type H+-transporting ATPase subunit alpha